MPQVMRSQRKQGMLKEALLQMLAVPAPQIHLLQVSMFAYPCLPLEDMFVCQMSIDPGSHRTHGGSLGLLAAAWSGLVWAAQ